MSRVKLDHNVYGSGNVASESPAFVLGSVIVLRESLQIEKLLLTDVLQRHWIDPYRYHKHRIADRRTTGMQSEGSLFLSGKSACAMVARVSFELL